MLVKSDVWRQKKTHPCGVSPCWRPSWKWRIWSKNHSVIVGLVV